MSESVCFRFVMLPLSALIFSEKSEILSMTASSIMPSVASEASEASVMYPPNAPESTSSIFAAFFAAVSYMSEISDAMPSTSPPPIIAEMSFSPTFASCFENDSVYTAICMSF